MSLDDLLTEYGTRYRVAKLFGYEPSTVYYWERIGYIPLQAQAHIAQETDFKFNVSGERKDV